MSNTRQARLPRMRFWTLAHRATALAFLAALIASWYWDISLLRGSVTSTRLLGWLPLMDPLAAAEVCVAARSVTTSIVIGAGITISTALLLGRVFCGWICPLGLILELNEQVRERLRRHVARQQRSLPQWQLPKSFKYWLLGSLLLASMISSVPLFTAVSPINLVTLAVYAMPTVGLVVIGAIVLFEYFVPRGFCRSLCPLGALYSLLGSFAPLRVFVRPGGKCLLCQQCSMRCPMGIHVMEDHVLSGHATVSDSECSRCGTCTDVCAGRMLQLNFRTPATPPVSCDGPSKSEVTSLNIDKNST
jgi:ferredoxin-type protein NapH